MKDLVATLMDTYGVRFDVNCSILFTELPLTQRAAAAKAAGFGGVEFWWPWQGMVPSHAEAVLVEPINSVDFPGFPVDTSGTALEVIKRVGAPNVGFLADLYHLATMGEDVSAVLSRHRDAILHVQVADAPGRGAPGTGTLDFEPLFARLAAQRYDGWVGLEYVPADPADSATSFAWL